MADRVQSAQSRQEETRRVGLNPQGDAVLRAGRPVERDAVAQAAE